METQLNDADRVIGDGDHGASMARGFGALITEMEKGKFTDLTSLFITAGNTLIASVGGSAGIIFGTFFRSGGKALEGSKTLDADGFTHFLAGAFEAIQHRGKARPGDKTMLDVLFPALEAAKAGKTLPIENFFQSIAEAAKTGMEETGNMVAKAGRAKDFRQKSIGQLDPGAITTYIIFDSMSRYISSIK